MKSALLLVVLLALAGCADRLSINTDYLSQGQSSRVQYIVLHYTSTDLAHSLALLTGPDVSSHYLIGDQPAPIIYRLVDEERRSWHAGESEWQGRTWLNASSIGVEIVHPGYRTLADGSREWQPYSPAQINLLITLLEDLVKRHQLPPDSVIGHSDVAPQRKVDPGPLFPWQRLAEAGLIRWPDEAAVLQARARHAQQLPDAAWFQVQLGRVGYRVPMHGEWDDATRNVLAAFQMKYRPQRHDGLPDAESAALLEVLNASLQ
ncbi:N-acetylmuramoyl-L-alanine amidase [Pseudomonas mangrovi]|uniref:N-acetylmuramoyl-L-alanine amidase n=1 Tax=Pseudomonas mangrovi TaxID=2161748 RepID=A0A2T5P9M8_9PSED|nr:N-acetylmuramoyl-L-alanine amidase [Pseudomonas mangrovi]PTU74429.1 N-acetylmuramoyl-L-alanine amidase [Pseudomonas mangrovi]